MWPRYFVPRRAEPDPAPAARGPLLLHVLDTFRLGGRGRSQREVAVVMDRSGALHLLDPADLPSSLVAGLHHHELTTGGRACRLLDVEELWLLSVQVLEQPGDAPGLNDPVYLYGRMYGPLPSGDPKMADGQLALTRADLLDGFVRSVGDAFHVGSDPPSRCLHAALPADRAEGIEQGRALVLAYALVPPELDPNESSNELLVAELVHDVLIATQADAKQLGVPHPLVGASIPVPSRQDLERDLDQQGWDVSGDIAIRRSDATKKGSIGGMFAQVFGVPDAMKIALPKEGSVDELLAVAERILPSFGGFPDRRALALRARTVRGSAPGQQPPPSPRQPSIPRGSVPRPPDPTPPSRSPDWMDDFVREHRSPRITRVGSQHSKPTAATGGKKPDWMNDFEDD